MQLTKPHQRSRSVGRVFIFIWRKIKVTTLTSWRKLSCLCFFCLIIFKMRPGSPSEAWILCKGGTWNSCLLFCGDLREANGCLELFVFMLSFSPCLLEFFRHIAIPRKLSGPSACRKIKKASNTTSSRSSGRGTQGTGLSGGKWKFRVDQVPEQVRHFLNKWEVSQLSQTPEIFADCFRHTFLPHNPHCCKLNRLLKVYPEKITATLFAIGCLLALVLASSLAHKWGKEDNIACVLKRRINSRILLDSKKFQNQLVWIMKKWNYATCL